MSYNSYSYSPYYQQQAQQPVASNGHGQSDQSNTNIPYYRSLADVPTQRIHAGTVQYSSASENYGTNYSYPSYRSSATIGGENTQQVAKGGAQQPSTYYDAPPRPHRDTSALGSLAYASALGRDGNSINQDQNNSTQYPTSADNGTSQSPYSSNMKATNGLSQARSDSRSSSKTDRINGQKNQVPVTPYAASIAANALAQTQESTHTAAPQYQHSSEQSIARYTHPTGQKAAYSDKNAGQNSITGVQDSLTTSVANAISLPAIQTTKSREPARSSKPQYRPSAPAAYLGARPATGSGAYHTASMPYQAVPSKQKTQSQVTSSTPEELSRYGSQSHSRDSSTMNAPRENLQTSSQEARITDADPNVIPSKSFQTAGIEYNTQSMNDQRPITVDPNQVFNVYEYQRRKAEAEAEAAKKAAEQRSLQDHRAAMHHGNMEQSVVGSNLAAGATSGPNVKQSSAESGSKEQIETEIKAMIEKMREYKAKDPAVFSEVWERFKQVSLSLHYTEAVNSLISFGLGSNI